MLERIYNPEIYPYVRGEVWIDGNGDTFWVARATQSTTALVDYIMQPLVPGDSYLPNDNSYTAFTSWNETSALANGFHPYAPENRYYVQDFGTVGDGVTDDTAAINAAIQLAKKAGSGASVEFEIGVSYAITVVNGASGVDLHGNNCTLNYIGAGDRPLTFTNVNHVSVENLTLNLGNKATGSGIFASGSDSLWFKRVNVTCATYGGTGFRLSSCTNSGIIFSSVSGTGNAWNLTSLCQYCYVLFSHATNTLAGVLVNNSGTNAPSDIICLGVVVDSFPGGQVLGYAMRSLGAAGTLNKRIKFLFCTVIGPNLAFNANGTADQLNMTYTDSGLILGCTSYYGGDYGISFSNCTNMRVIANDCQYNDTCGIGPSNSSTLITIDGNTCLNNGQNRTGSHSTTDVLAGILIGASTSHITINSNILGDTQGAPTQNYGISCSSTVAAATDVNIGVNTYSGNKLGTINNGNASTGTKVSTTAL